MYYRHKGGGPGQSGDVGAYSSTICTTDTKEGVPDNRGKSDPLAVLFVLQTQEKGVPDNREMSEEEEKGVEEWRRGGEEGSAATRENIQPPTDVGE